MANSFDHNHLRVLMYRLTGQKVAEQLGVTSKRTLIAWLDGRSAPTNEQATNIAHMHEQLIQSQPTHATQATTSR